MLEDPIPDSEKLFRAVPNFPNYWNDDLERPSSALFKDANGVSVDRQGKREIEQAHKKLIKKFKNKLKAIASITAGQCRELNTHPVYKPSKNNKYHSEIHDSKIKIRITSAKAFNLSSTCELNMID